MPYDVWARDGSLNTTPGKSIEYEFVAEHLRGLFDQFDIRSVAFDSWGFKHLRPWLLRAGFSEDEIEARFVEFGQSYAMMSPALRTLEGDLLEGRMVHGNHPVLTMCAANAVVIADGKENRMLTKKKSRGRIDGMVALAMARAVAGTHVDEPVLDVFAMVA